MEQNYVNPLPFKHISTAANEAVTYIRRRKTMKLNHLKVGGINSMKCVVVELNLVVFIQL